MKEKIIKYFEDNEDALLRDLERLVAVPSFRGEAAEGAPFGVGPREALETGLRIAREHGLSAEIRGDRVLVIELGEGEPVLGIMAHLDVVPPAGEWTVTGPFEMKRQGDMIYGRGVIDDKGPAVVSMYALLCVRELGLVRGKVQLLLGSDEECGSGDFEWYMEHYKMPPMVFTPDGSFPVVNTEKGKMNFTVTAPAYTGEALHVVSLSGGSVPNAVPAEAQAVLSDGSTIKVTGRAAHGSLPQEGDNAVTKLVSQLAAMEGPGFDLFRALERAIPHGDYSGTAVGAGCSDELSGALTVNLGVMTYDLTSGLRAECDCRIPVCGDGRAIVEKYAKALEGSAQVTVHGLLAPHHTPEDSLLVRSLLRIYQDYTGTPGKCLALGGLTYVHEVEGGVAFGAEFPGSEGHMHEPDERAKISELKLSGAMFAQAVAELCG